MQPGGETITKLRIKPESQDTDGSYSRVSEPTLIHTVTDNTFSVMRRRVALEAVAVATVLVIPFSVHAGFLTKLGALITAAPTADTAAESVIVTNPADVSLLSSVTNPDPRVGGGEVMVEDGVLVSTGPVGDDEIAANRQFSGQIQVHTVRPCTEESCETLSHIAEMYSVSVATIMWANDITDATTVQPGDALVILPISGVQHEVVRGETLAEIADEYEADLAEVLEFNRLASAEAIAPGDTIIVPGAQITMAAPATPVSSSGGAWLSHPAPGATRTQGIHGYNAVDLAAGHGTVIRAAAGGEVMVAKSSGWNGGYGNYVVVRHSNGAQTLYAHLSSVNVGVGAWVSQGQTIGGMGSTGRSTGTHLHFEVRGAANPF